MRALVVGLSLASAAIAGCTDDPTLQVIVVHERPPIATSVITVYQAPTATCEDIEFGDLDDAALAPLAVAALTLTDAGSSGGLEDLSRTARKLVVARGYAADGELLEAGCVPHDEIVGADTAEVITHPIASVSAAQTDGTGYELGVLVTDRDGAPLADRAISYRMYGPAGSVPARADGIREMPDGNWRPVAPSCTDGSGLATLHPVTPNTVGGFFTSLRASWARQPAQTFSGLANTNLGLEAIDFPPETVHPCAVSVRGATTRLVCVVRKLPARAAAHAYTVTLGADGLANVTRLAPEVILDAPPVALVALPGESVATDRDVYAVDATGKLTALFDAAPATTCGAACASNVTDVLYAPACGSDPARLLLRATVTPGVDDSLLLAPPRGGPIETLPGTGPGAIAPLALNSSGCVTTTTASGNVVRQLTVIDTTISRNAFSVPVTLGFYSCGTSCKVVQLPVAAAATAFTRGTPYLIGAANDATGVVLATWALVPDPTSSADLLVERAARIPSVANPEHIAVGTFDADAGTDLLWDLALPATLGSSFELAYSRPVGAGVLQALSGAQPFATTDLFSADVTGDARDDVLVITRGLAASTTGVAVLATVPAGPVTIPADLPCAR